jgi:hypothetical protein
MNFLPSPMNCRPFPARGKLNAERKGPSGAPFYWLREFRETECLTKQAFAIHTQTLYRQKKRALTDPRLYHPPIALLLNKGERAQTGTTTSPVNPFGKTTLSIPSILAGSERGGCRAKPKLQDRVTCKSYHAACRSSHDGAGCG